MTRQRLRSADGTRGAEVYLCAGTLSTYRIRAEKYPEHWDHMGDAYWWGGRVLWDHDQPSMAAAVEVANRWVVDGLLPAPRIHGRLTEVTFSAIPENNINHDIYSVKVTWRGDDRYAVERLSQCLGRDGTWDYEPNPSGRTDEWIAEHRFDYDTACRLAAEAALHVTVNGFTVADALARAGRRD